MNVPSGSTAANETRVTFVNQPAGGTKGDLKICKLSETPAFWGRQFSFTVNGGPAFSTEANPAFEDPAHWSCRLAGSYPVGSKVRVQELIPAGAEIAYIDSDPADRLLDFDTNAGTADVLIGSGMTVVLYDNEAPAPEGQGWLEVCKDRAKLGYHDYDWDVEGPFDFLVTDAAGSEYELTILAGQCSAPIQVAAGISRVEELHRPGFDLVDVFTIPEDRLLDVNLINRTADVEVPTSDNPNDETQVHFVNKAQRAQLKLCKALGPGSSALIGETFEFDVSPNPNGSGAPKMIMNGYRIKAASSTQCIIIGDYVIGTEVTIDENLDAYPYVRATGEGTYTIKPGINTVTITNQALGKLEICKFLKEDVPADKTFYFRIDGGPKLAVRAYRCSQPQLVIPGSHTVTEESDPDYELDPNAPGNGIVVTPAVAEQSRNLLARSVTVHVPYAGAYGDEVRVDFWNRIRRGQIKVCKHVESGSVDSIGDKEFEFTISSNNTKPVVDTVGGFPTPFVLRGVRNGECRLVPDGSTGAPRNVPVLKSDGSRTTITVTETSGAGYMVSDVTLQGGRNLNWTSGNTASFDLYPNTNTIHFTNKATPSN